MTVDGMTIKSHAPDKLKVFISYSRKDIFFAQQLVSGLEQRGLAVTIDTRDLPTLEDWRRELLGFIRNSDAVVFVITTAAVSSKMCAWEIEQVVALNKRLAPVVLEKVPDDHIPEAASKINYLSFDQPSHFEEQTDKLADALQVDLSWVKEHTRLGEHARRWHERQRSSSLLLRGRELEEADRWAASRPRKAPDPTAKHLELIVDSRKASQRRQRAWVGGSLFAAIFSFSLAGTAIWQRQVAVKSEAIALVNEGRAVDAQKAEELQRQSAETQRRIAVEQRMLAQKNETFAQEQRVLAGKNEQIAIEERDQAQLAQARALSLVADQQLEIGNTTGALLLALEAADIIPKQFSETAITNTNILDSVTAAALAPREQLIAGDFPMLGGAMAGLERCPGDRATILRPVRSNSRVKSYFISDDYEKTKEATPIEVKRRDCKQVVAFFSTREALKPSKIIVDIRFMNDVMRVQFSDKTSVDVKRHIGENGWADYAFVSPDSRRIVAGQVRKGVVFLGLYNATNGQLIKVLETASKGTPEVRFNASSTEFITVGDRDTVVVRDAVTGEDRMRLNSYSRSITALSINSDGTLLASGYADGNVRVWDRLTGRVVVNANIGSAEPVEMQFDAASANVYVSTKLKANTASIALFKLPTARFQPLTLQDASAQKVSPPNEDLIEPRSAECQQIGSAQKIQIQEADEAGMLLRSGTFSMKISNEEGYLSNRHVLGCAYEANSKRLTTLYVYQGHLGEKEIYLDSFGPGRDGLNQFPGRELFSRASQSHDGLWYAYAGVGGSIKILNSLTLRLIGSIDDGIPKGGDIDGEVDFFFSGDNRKLIWKSSDNYRFVALPPGGKDIMRAMRSDVWRCLTLNERNRFGLSDITACETIL